MSKNELLLKPINSLLNERFFIPGYQRGYRWSQRQVEDLLEDIREFQLGGESKPKGSFYCLQPLVVRKMESGEWELIDGQQRLTTRFLILKCLNKLMEAWELQPYSLRYETREGSAEFLREIDPSKAMENIDYFHMDRALKTIKAWFEKMDSSQRNAFFQTLISSDEVGKNVKVIWYEIGEESDR